MKNESNQISLSETVVSKQKWKLFGMCRVLNMIFSKNPHCWNKCLSKCLRRSSPWKWSNYIWIWNRATIVELTIILEENFHFSLLARHSNIQTFKQFPVEPVFKWLSSLMFSILIIYNAKPYRMRIDGKHHSYIINKIFLLNMARIVCHMILLGE